MYFKKNDDTRFGEPSISRLASFRPKPGNDKIPVSTKMSHLWCYFQLFFIHHSTIRQFDNSTFIIRHFIIRHFIIRQFDIRQFDSSTIRHFIISNFRKSTALPQIKSSVANYMAMWFKKNHDTRFGEPSISRLASIRPKPGNDTIPVSKKMSHLWCYFQLFYSHHSTFRHFIIRLFDVSTFDSSTFIILNFRKSTALPQIKSSVSNYVAMWFKKNHDTRFGEPSISPLTPIRPKPGNDKIPVSTKMSHLWCYFQLFDISTFHHSTFPHFDISSFDISSFDSSTIDNSTFRRFDIHHHFKFP